MMKDQPTKETAKNHDMIELESIRSAWNTMEDKEIAKHYARIEHQSIRVCTSSPDNMRRMPLFTDEKIFLMHDLYCFSADQREFFLRLDHSFDFLKETRLGEPWAAETFLENAWPRLMGEDVDSCLAYYLPALTENQQLLLCRILVTDIVYNINPMDYLSAMQEPIVGSQQEQFNSLYEWLEHALCPLRWVGWNQFFKLCEELGIYSKEYWLSVILRYGLWDHADPEVTYLIDWRHESYTDLDQWCNASHLFREDSVGEVVVKEDEDEESISMKIYWRKDP